MMDGKYDRLKLDNQLCFPLYAASRKVVGAYTPYLRKLGITYTHYIVFMVLWEKDNLTVGEIGNKLYLDNGTLSPVLKKMEEKGFVERRRSTKDERVVKISLTKKGKALRDEAADLPEKVSSCLNLDEEEAVFLHSLLYKILG